jgi:hypothetical protein
MNCAAVNITTRAEATPSQVTSGTYGQARDGDQTPSLIPFSSRPFMLVADDGNGCLTPSTDAELKFPESGPDAMQGDGGYPLRLPSGNCTGLGHWDRQDRDGSL